MSWLKDVRQAIRGLGALGPESRQNLENPETPISSDAAVEHFGVQAGSTGVSVNEDRAMGIASIYAGIRVIAESVASLPLETYRRINHDARERYREHPSYTVLKTRPNPFMSAFNYWELALKQLVFRGNHYAELEFDANGYVVNMWPLVPEYTHPVLTKRDSLVYVTQIGGQRIGLPSYRVLHISALGNGIEGEGILEYGKETLGYAAALDEYQGRFFSNGAHPSGFLKYAGNGKLSTEARNRIAAAWQMSHGGLSNAHRTAVFEENLEWTRTAVNPEEAQAIESRKLTRSELAGILRVPAHFINDLERATFSNIEHLSLDFVIHSLRPWLVRIEQELNYKLFRAEPDIFCEFNVDGLLRGDKKSRAEALEIERRNGVITPNEWRRIENKNPIDNDYGESFLVPLNNAMVSAGGEFMPVAAEGEHQARADQLSLSPIVVDAASRLLRREVREVRKLMRSAEAQQGVEELHSVIAEYYADTAWAETITAPINAAAGRSILDANKWFSRSQEELLNAATTGGAEAVEEQLREWERIRIAEVRNAVSE